MYFTSCEPSVDFVHRSVPQALESNLNFKLKVEQKIAVDCLLEGRDVFVVMPTGFGKCFFLIFSAVLHDD